MTNYETTIDKILDRFGQKLEKLNQQDRLLIIAYIALQINSPELSLPLIQDKIDNQKFTINLSHDGSIFLLMLNSISSAYYPSFLQFLSIGISQQTPFL